MTSILSFRQLFTLCGVRLKFVLCWETRREAVDGVPSIPGVITITQSSTCCCLPLGEKNSSTSGAGPFLPVLLKRTVAPRVMWNFHNLVFCPFFPWVAWSSHVLPSFTDKGRQEKRQTLALRGNTNYSSCEAWGKIRPMDTCLCLFYVSLRHWAYEVHGWHFKKIYIKKIKIH